MLIVNSLVWSLLNKELLHLGSVSQFSPFVREVLFLSHEGFMQFAGSYLSLFLERLASVRTWCLPFMVSFYLDDRQDDHVSLSE